MDRSATNGRRGEASEGEFGDTGEGPELLRRERGEWVVARGAGRGARIVSSSTLLQPPPKDKIGKI